MKNFIEMVGSQMKILSLIKPYDKPVNTVGASWVGIYLSNLLVNDPRIESVGLLTNLSDYSMIDPRVRIHELDYRHSSENKDMITEAIKIYREFNYDIIHVHVGSLAIIKWMQLLIPDDVNVVYTLHSSLMLGRSTIVYGPYGKLLNNKKNFRIVAVSDFMQNVWREFTSDNDPINNLSTIYNGVVEYNDITPLSIDKRTKQVMVCSRITPAKNILEVLRVLDKYNINTVFVGDNYTINPGNEFETNYYLECKTLLENSKCIKWFSFLNNHDVRQLMSESYAVVHMTSMEACSLVLLETMSVGTPVIYGKCDSIIEMMNLNNDPDKLGSFINYRSGARWSTKGSLINESINRIFEEPKDPTIISEYYYKNFSNKAMIDNYVNVYKSF
jgi:glycosyltransferase involved in cell wall biosynthesis